MNHEKVQERVWEIQSNRTYIPASLRDVPVEHLLAVIGLSGGEAYLEDVKWGLENLFGHRVESVFDLEDLLKAYRNAGIKYDVDMKRDRSLFKLGEEAFRMFDKEVKEYMRKAMGYEKIGLEALFDPAEEGKKFHIWENFKWEA
jgi:hypothetical protein